MIVVGLGNPGKEYDGTRHNVGRDVVELGVRSWELGDHWQQQPMNHAEVMSGTISGHRVLLAKSTTFMNDSGRAVSALLHHCSRLTPHTSRLVVVHDDLDLPIGALRLSTNGSSGGHKGVQSVIDAIGTKDFLRLRIGIGPNATPEGARIPAEDFVLKRFRAEERPIIASAIARAVEAMTILLRDGLPAAQQFANAKE